MYKHTIIKEKHFACAPKYVAIFIYRLPPPLAQFPFRGAYAAYQKLFNYQHFPSTRSKQRETTLNNKLKVTSKNNSHTVSESESTSEKIRRRDIGKNNNKSSFNNFFYSAPFAVVLLSPVFFPVKWP